MKAHISAGDKLSNSQRAAVTEYAQKIIDDNSKAAMRKFFKLMCIALNDDFEFGKYRLYQLIDTIQNLAEDHMTDEVFWEHVDIRVIDKMGLEFEREEFKLYD